MNSYIAKTIEHKGLTIKIVADDDPESPREWDNLGTMLCFHNRYELGDKNIELGFYDEDGMWQSRGKDDFGSWQEVGKFLEEKKGAIIILPLYLYDHSGLRMKVGSFKGYLPQGHAEFDSGQVGFIYVTEDQIKKEYGKVTKKNMELAEKVLRGEVEDYDTYLSGDIWGYVIGDEEGDDIESCWGFYGMDTAIEEAKGVADSIISNRLNEKQEKLKKQIRGGAPLEARL